MSGCQSSSADGPIQHMLLLMLHIMSTVEVEGSEAEDCIGIGILQIPRDPTKISRERVVLTLVGEGSQKKLVGPWI